MQTLVTINELKQGNISVFYFSGELDETNADTAFTDLYKRIGNFKNKSIILNLTGLNYINSKSVGFIADIFSHIDEKEGKMSISNCTEPVKDVLDLVGITAIIPIVDTEKEALAAMA